MQIIVADMLWTGNARAARDGHAISAAGIEAVVDLAYEEEPAVLPRSLTYCRLPLIDGDGNESWALKLALQTVVALIDSEIPTLVACSAGMSRSPSIAIAAFAMSAGRNPDDELRRLADSCTFCVGPALWHQVVATSRAIQAGAS